MIDISPAPEQEALRHKRTDDKQITDTTKEETMYLQIITFRLDGMTPGEFAAINDHVATQYGEVPGLISKIFLADPDDDHAYGGVYLWKTRDDAEQYLQNGLAQALVKDPRFIDLQTRLMGVLPGPTSITGGPVAGFVARPAA